MIEKSARLSDCEKYRYTLYRRWNAQGGRVAFLMFNPSTADANLDDATIRKCIGFAARWDYGEMGVVNLFAYRSRFPESLDHVDDPVGPQTNYWIDRVLEEAKLVVCAWGCDAYLRTPQRQQRIAEVLERIARTYPALPIMCLGVTQKGAPRHPLMLAYATPLQPYPVRTEVNVPSHVSGVNRIEGAVPVSSV